MQDIEPQDELDALLSRHLHAQLDGQLGKAEVAFRQSLDCKTSPYRLWLKPAMALAAGLAAAAVVMLAIHLPNHEKHWPLATTTRLNRPPAKVTDEQGNPQLRTAQVIASGFADGGIVTLRDGTPAQEVFQRYLLQTRIYDPVANTVLENTQPRERVLLVKLNHY